MDFTIKPQREYKDRLFKAIFGRDTEESKRWMKPWTGRLRKSCWTAFSYFIGEFLRFFATPKKCEPLRANPQKDKEETEVLRFFATAKNASLREQGKTLRASFSLRREQGKTLRASFSLRLEKVKEIAEQLRMQNS